MTQQLHVNNSLSLTLDINGLAILFFPQDQLVMHSDLSQDGVVGAYQAPGACWCT